MPLTLVTKCITEISFLVEVIRLEVGGKFSLKIGRKQLIFG